MAKWHGVAKAARYIYGAGGEEMTSIIKGVIMTRIISVVTKHQWRRRRRKIQRQWRSGVSESMAHEIMKKIEEEKKKKSAKENIGSVCGGGS